MPCRIDSGVALASADSLVRALGTEPGGRVAIVAFAGRAVLRCPLTENLGAALERLRSLRPGGVEPGGSDLAAALDAALAALDADHSGPEEGRAIVVLSDGEFHGGSWASFVPRLKESRIPVHTAAIGDPDQGHEIPVAVSEGPARPLTYQDQVVLSKRDDTSLRAISTATGGAFLPIGQKSVDLGRLYNEQIRPEALRRRRSESQADRIDRFPLFLAAALVLGVGGFLARVPAATALADVARGIAGGEPMRGRGPRPSPRWSASGRLAYDRGNFATALADFEQAIVLRPDHPLPRYDTAATLYQLGQFVEAEARYREAREQAGPALRMKIDYALGNCAFARGDYRAALEDYDRCLASEVAGAEFNRLRADASKNRAEAEKRIPPEPSEPQESAANDQPRPDDPGSGSERSDEANPSEPPPSSPPSPDDASSPTNESPPGRSSGSGAGDSGSSERENPVDRLASAIDNIQQAKSRRPDRPDIFAPASDLKDW